MLPKFPYNKSGKHPNIWGGIRFYCAKTNRYVFLACLLPFFHPNADWIRWYLYIIAYSVVSLRENGGGGSVGLWFDDLLKEIFSERLCVFEIMGGMEFFETHIFSNILLQ